jgi:hypothetical protein
VLIVRTAFKDLLTNTIVEFHVFLLNGEDLLSRFYGDLFCNEVL